MDITIVADQLTAYGLPANTKTGTLKVVNVILAANIVIDHANMTNAENQLPAYGLPANTKTGT